MKNDEEQWQEQRWRIPENTMLIRKEGKWSIEYSLGVGHRINSEMGKLMSVYFMGCNMERDRIFRRSLKFRWQRFWYLRSKSRKQFLAELEERKNQSNLTQ
jgi:hypothetical protein